MRVFLTGSTGFIGSRIVPELLAAGHRVLGLTRSDAGARWLAEQGAEAHRGDLEHPEILARGAASADAVIHTAFDHDFTNFVANCEKDRRAVEAMGDALAGSDRPLIITSGTAIVASMPAQVATEDDVNWESPNPRVASELAGAAAAANGVSVAVVRLPQVHDPVKHGLASPLVEIALKQGVSAYIGDGTNRWPAAHVTDVARLYRLALDRHQGGARYHAVGEEGIPMRDIAQAIGEALRLPVTSLPAEPAEGHFGWLTPFVGMDMPASSAWTRDHLGWQPTGAGLLADLRAMRGLQ